MKFQCIYEYITCSLNYRPSRRRFPSAYKQMVRWFSNSKLLPLLHIIFLQLSGFKFIEINPLVLKATKLFFPNFSI